MSSPSLLCLPVVISHSPVALSGELFHFIIDMSRMFRRKKTQVHYVPRLLPPQPDLISWGSSSKPAIIRLFEAGKDAEEISDITRNRISFVKSVIYRHAHPEDFVITPIPRRPRSSSKISRPCLGCGNVILVSPSQSTKYCSMACRSVSITIECLSCKKKLAVPPCRIERGCKYCSRECYRSHRYGIKTK